MNNLMSDKIDELAQALCNVQAIMTNVTRDKDGVHSKKYADLGSCLNAVRTPLSDNNIAISQIVAVENDIQVLVTLLMHTSGQWLKSTFNIGDKLSANGTWQQTGIAITYARRYALSAIIGLAQEDDDAQSLDKKEEQAQIQQKVKNTADTVNALTNLCKDNGISAKKFAEFHKITGQNLEDVKRGIDNFAQLKEEFENAQSSNSH